MTVQTILASSHFDQNITINTFEYDLIRYTFDHLKYYL